MNIRKKVVSILFNKVIKSIHILNKYCIVISFCLSFLKLKTYIKSKFFQVYLVKKSKVVC